MQGSFMRRRVNLIIALVLLFVPAMVTAESLNTVKKEYQAASQEGDGLQAKVDEHDEIAETLEGQIGAINAQIASVKGRIIVTKARLAELKSQVAAKQAILNIAIKEQYVSPEPTGFELVVTSSNVGELMDRQAYLEKTQEHIKELMSSVVEMKKQMEKQSEQLDREQAGLDQQVAAKNELLAQTRGEQARYAKMLEDNKAARARLSQTIAKLSSNGPLQSKGYVTRGTVIGREGSTGFSTGSHLHFTTYLNGKAVNPLQYINSGRIGWPENGHSITQNFGPAGWSNPVYSFHDGIDMSAGYGAPILAACDGNIVMNSFQAGGFGHYILIDCGGGLQTLYGHMQ